MLLLLRSEVPGTRYRLRSFSSGIGSQTVILAIRLDSNKTVLIIYNGSFYSLLSGKSNERGVV